LFLERIFMSSSDLLKVAFIGVGWWGDVLADAAVASGAAEVVGGFARTAGTREKFAEKFWCKNYGSLEALLADPNSEAVVIASANGVHKEHTLAAAKAGKHIHLEKPMAFSIADCKEMVSACEAAGVKLGIGQNFRRWPMFRRVKKMIDAGELGTVSLASVNFSGPLGLTAGEGSPRWDPVENPGGPLYSYTIHLADLMEGLFGEIDTVHAVCGKVGGPSKTDDTAAGVLHFKSGMLGIISGSYTAPFRFMGSIEGTRGALSFSSGAEPTFQKFKDAMVDAETLDIGYGFWDGRDLGNAEQFSDLRRAIREGGDPEVNGTNGIRALGVMQAMLKSNSEGRTVSMEEVLVD
jgi:predicted dehydrogenase